MPTKMQRLVDRELECWKLSLREPTNNPALAKNRIERLEKIKTALESLADGVGR